MTFANLMKAYILLMLRGYKAILSPMLPNACRFVPTCSEYATEAIDRYGAFRGGLKAIWRLLRCNLFPPAVTIPLFCPTSGRHTCVCLPVPRSLHSSRTSHSYRDLASTDFQP